MEEMMRKVWIVLLTVTSLVSIVFSVKTAIQLQEYFSLDAVAKAASMEWEIVEKNASAFALHVSYQFTPLGKGAISGRVELAKPYFLNLPSAERAVKEFSREPWDVFYCMENPSISSLQKNFPFKDCIQTLLTLGIFVYFLFFKKIMEKSTQEW